MATALLVAGSTLTFRIPFASTSSYPSVVQKACSYNFRRLTYSTLVPIYAHVTWWHAVQLIELWRPKRRQTLLQRSQSCHKGEFRYVSISAQQRSLRCEQNLNGPFLRATLPMTVGSCARAMAIYGRQKRSELHSRGEFLHNYYMFESMHDGDHDGVVRIFVGLSCELGGLII